MAVTFARELEIKQMNFAQASQLPQEEFAFWEQNKAEQNEWEMLDAYEMRSCIPQEY